LDFEFRIGIFGGFLEALNLVEDNFAEVLELRFWISLEKLQKEAGEAKFS